MAKSQTNKPVLRHRERADTSSDKVKMRNLMSTVQAIESAIALAEGRGLPYVYNPVTLA